MGMDMFKDIVDNYLTLEHPCDQRGIVLSGGEPSLHPQIAEMIDYIHTEYDHSVRMATNGAGIPDLLLEGVLQERDGIQVSLDGNKAAHDGIRGLGSYDDAIMALMGLEDAGIKHGIQFTVHADNYNYIYHILDVAENVNADWVGVNWYHDLNGGPLKPVSREIFDVIQKGVDGVQNNDHGRCYFNGCVGGILGVSVLADGTYWDCTRNQKVLGKYPQKIEECLYWDKIEARLTVDPALTCMKVK
jgi:MoaA/NifB/PqqE/SkfB family radical SAM enzyme